MKRSAESKIIRADELVRRLRRPRQSSLAFTNGCFDILHRGHVESLEYARSLADELVVAVNSDESVRRLKGSRRPVTTVDDRVRVLAALEAIDWVTIFEDDTPAALIAELLPDVLVKGGDYRIDEVVGGDDVVRAGGRVVIAPLVPGRSTSNLIQKTRDELQQDR